MEFIEFTQQIQNLLRERNGTVDVVIQTCTKNNGVEYTGVTIREINSNMAPVIYLEPYYSRYMNSGNTISEIVSDIEKVYLEHKHESIAVDWINDYDRVKERIIAVVVNKSRNEELLSKIPNREFVEDISVVYKILIDNFDNETATVLVNENLMSIWNVSEEDIFNQSMINNKTLCKPVRQGMCEVLFEMLGEKDNEELVELVKCVDEDIYVLSTEAKIQGASVILNNDFMKSMVHKVGEGFVIPSSIHELLYIPAKRNSDIAENINSMISEVNCTQLITEEILGDKAYYYNGYSYEMIK